MVRAMTSSCAAAAQSAPPGRAWHGRSSSGVRAAATSARIRPSAGAPLCSAPPGMPARSPAVSSAFAALHARSLDSQPTPSCPPGCSSKTASQLSAASSSASWPRHSRRCDSNAGSCPCGARAVLAAPPAPHQGSAAPDAMPNAAHASASPPASTPLPAAAAPCTAPAAASGAAASTWVQIDR
eukprot:351159-Chlamydomonas_euryale.AAC.3